jgi:chromosome partitioning protein
MSFTIVVANSKGGCGKTTLAMLLAGALAKHLDVTVVDSDPQGTASIWSKQGPFPCPVVAADPDNASDQLRELAQERQAVVVDCPPNLGAPVFHAAMSAADILLVPCAPEPADAWATELLLEFCREFYPAVRLVVVVNKIPSVGALAKEVLQFIEAGWPVAKARFGLRTAYKEAAALGSTLDGLKGTGARAAREEVQALALEVLTTLTQVAA